MKVTRRGTRRGKKAQLICVPEFDSGAVGGGDVAAVLAHFGARYRGFGLQCADHAPASHVPQSVSSLYPLHRRVLCPEIETNCGSSEDT